MHYNALLSELRAFYEHNAAARDQSPKSDWKVAERERFLSFLQRESKQRLLEIGAGTGHDSAFFQDQGLDVVCTDLSPAMVERCRQKGLTADVSEAGGAVFREWMAAMKRPANNYLVLDTSRPLADCLTEAIAYVIQGVNDV